LSDQEKTRQRELLLPILDGNQRSAGLNMNGEPASLHSELLALADITVDRGTSKSYGFNLDGELTGIEGPGLLVIIVADGTIESAECSFPDW
jgi:hypothetical protein